jgi:hypothetical protein
MPALATQVSDGGFGQGELAVDDDSQLTRVDERWLRNHGIRA